MKTSTTLGSHMVSEEISGQGDSRHETKAPQFIPLPGRTVENPLAARLAGFAMILIYLTAIAAFFYLGAAHEFGWWPCGGDR